MPECRAVVVVLAKAPVPGRVKTRLMPLFTAVEAASLARAALLDTVSAARELPGVHLVAALEGRLTFPLAVDEIIRQRGDGLAERIDAAFADAGREGLPTLLIGMDTPQVTPGLLAACLDRLEADDAVLGHAVDGGWWALGLRTHQPHLLRGVPMSTAVTGAETENRLRAAGYAPAPLPMLVDVDTAADAELVSALAPHGRFARLLGELRAA